MLCVWMKLSRCEKFVVESFESFKGKLRNFIQVLITNIEEVLSVR